MSVRVRFPPEAQRGRADVLPLCALFRYQWLNLHSYFRNTKNTARTRQKKAAMWFQWRASPLKMKVTTTVNTTKDTTSWMTFSCRRLNGPPLPEKPRRLAGTWAQYSKKASPQEKRMTRIRGQLVEIFISWSFRWPYHANVMNMLESTNRRTVPIAFI